MVAAANDDDGVLHHRSGANVPSDAEPFSEKFHYSRSDAAGNANPLPVDTAKLMRPSTALDLGCGADGDTLWLAEQGWQVTAVDISSTAVERVRAHAGELRYGIPVTAEQHDLAPSLPTGSFDLVSAQYFSAPFALPRAQVLRTAAEALRPGGCPDHRSRIHRTLVVESRSRRGLSHTSRDRRRTPPRSSAMVSLTRGHAAAPGHRPCQADRHRQRPARSASRRMSAE